MKRYLLLALLCFLASCQALTDAPPSVERAVALAPVPARLFTVELPAGMVPGFDVAFRGDNKTRYTLPAGYDGFRFVGQGAGVTHVKAPYSANEWHNSSIFVGPFDGQVELVGMTIHGARDKAVHFGLATKSWNGTDYVVTRPVLPNFKLSLIDCEIVADVEADGHRPKWGVFGYQGNLLVQRTIFRWKNGVEHASYWHGFASQLGSTWISSEVVDSSAENDKIRNDNQEIQWVPGARIIRRNVKYGSHGEPWSWRGEGANIVFQGTGAAAISIDGCTFISGAGRRGRCISIDDGGTRVDGRPDYYDAVTGAIGGPFANGYVIVQNCAIYSGPGESSYSDQLTFVNWHGRADYPHKVSRGILFQNNGVYGERMLAKFQAGTDWLVRDCNTPLVKARCESLGINTAIESLINGNPMVPFSKGGGTVSSSAFSAAVQ